MKMTPSRQHALYRTNPKGFPFVGTCSQCGKKGLTLASLREECENPRGLTQEESVLDAIDPQRLK